MADLIHEITSSLLPNPTPVYHEFCIGCNIRYSTIASACDILFYVFQNTAIETVVFPSGVVEIGNYAVSSCQNLKHLHIHEKTAKLGEGLVYNDSALESVNIPNGVKSLKLKTLATEVMLNGSGRCCASQILVPLGSLKTLLKSPFEAYHIVSIAAATYMENIAHFGKKEQKAWDTYIAENADQIREKLGDNLNAEIAQYYADNGL